MTERKARTNKVILLGVDGLDPRLTRKYVDEGKMPNTKKFIERGAQRHDLTMLGGHPTVTPPMWTTLATGCYANVHGITGFFRCGDDIDEIDYNIDSRLCKAEPLWNVTAEAGLKTLVFHWPGCAWPPTSDSPNLMVIDGTTPGVVGTSTCTIDSEFIVAGNEKFEQLRLVPMADTEASAACVIDDLDVEDANEGGGFSSTSATKTGSNSHKSLVWKEAQLCGNFSDTGVDTVRTPIKPASGWAAAPADAKEFTILLSGGLIRRPCLILKNEQGVYDHIAIYKKKSETEPIATVNVGDVALHVLDDAISKDKTYHVIRNFRLLRLAEDGSTLLMHVTCGMDTENDTVFHPKRLFKELKENVGTPVPKSLLGHQEDLLITDCMLNTWYDIIDYQADAIRFLIEAEDLDVVFSHMHNVDAEEHMFIKHLAERPFNRNPVSMAQKWMENLYKQTDYYIGKFVDLLDEGWTVFIFSDHAQVAPASDLNKLMDMNSAACALDMAKLGYTVLKKDENGNDIGEIDWTKTTAVMQREGHVYLNIKGRNKHKLPDGTVIDGIVDPADQYALEEKIMGDLYALRSEEDGTRIVSVALRNRDAVLLGMGGPETGDIFVCVNEGHNFDHADSLSTTLGESDTSVSPIFIAAGKGIKEGYETDRIIRQVDLVPTVAALLGTRMPAQCEGAPVYQIFEEEF